MILDLPFGKALIPVKNETKQPECNKCYFFNNCSTKLQVSAGDFVACRSNERKDSKKVHYELVDFRQEKTQ